MKEHYSSLYRKNLILVLLPTEKMKVQPLMILMVVLVVEYKVY
jgi:hypothetical protein